MNRYYAENRAKVRAQVKEHRKVHGERLREIDRARWNSDRREKSNTIRKESFQKSRVEVPWKNLLRIAQQRAKRKQVPYALTEEWAKENWTGRCAVSDIEFQLGLRQFGPKFYSPSIDRIIPSLGYVPDNCRFVIWAVNAMKYDGTDNDLFALAEAIISNRKSPAKSST